MIFKPLFFIVSLELRRDEFVNRISSSFVLIDSVSVNVSFLFCCSELKLSDLIILGCWVLMTYLSVFKSSKRFDSSLLTDSLLESFFSRIGFSKWWIKYIMIN